ncbi:DEAD/DEAH box helicase family protein [Massilia sp. CCM 8734]|uniref:DEAD/DEAH box helicase n=1 Tax=Massilia sp. CCM 8734 TaxID=2609283 RepID=UPI00141EA759|nr:DEAD/DEAH box helicase family protein [Massilia sp. CCM 8734]NHZ98067.1 DEAD/DEAH box helicase [Massilia sp. CCM 8734]
MTPNYASTKFPVPRPFQTSAREKLREGFKAGHRCQMVMSPTGSGKTILAMFLTHEALMRDKRVIFVADRRTLINQTSEVADSLGLIQHSVMMAGHWRFDPSRNFQIASAQTLARRSWPDADLIIVDEAHTQLKAVTDHIQTCRAAVIGLSATPFSAGLGKLYHNLVNATTMRDLTESGVLVPMRVMSCTKVNMEGAATAGGEWTDKAAQERGMEIVGDVVHEWIKHAEGRKTIVFGATIAHCEAMAREFNTAGIMATVFTAETTEAERKDILADFKAADTALRVLISVEALAKGFDQRDVSCVCDVRPLRKSLSTAIQMWGRGLRASPETGKTDLLLLDFSGNIVRFAEDFEVIYHEGLDALDMGEKLDKTIRKDDEEESDHPANCPQCQFVPFRKRCMSCGFEIIKENLIEHAAGEMVEFKVGKAVVGNKLAVWEQACTLCRNQGKPETAKGRAFHLFRSITGAEPKGLPSFDAVPNVPISRAVMNKAKANAIAYRAGHK